MAFSPDGRRLATAGFGGKVGLYEVKTGEGELFKAHEGRVTSVDFDATGNLLLSSGNKDYRVRLWDLGQSPPKLAVPLLESQDAITWATLRPDARQLAVVGREQVVTLHDLPPGAGGAMTDGSVRHLGGDEQTVFRLARRLVSHKQTAIRSTRSHPIHSARRLVGHEQTVFRAEYTPDGAQLATVGGDMTLRLWDLGSDSNKPLFTLRLPDRPESAGPWDLALRCLPAAGGLVGDTGAANTHPDAGHCWLAVPLTMGRLALYRLPYAAPPAR